MATLSRAASTRESISSVRHGATDEAAARKFIRHCLPTPGDRPPKRIGVAYRLREINAPDHASVHWPLNRMLTLSGFLPYNSNLGIDRGGLMMPRESNRTSRLEARIAPDALLIVKRAAEIQGRSVSDFVVAAAQEAAQRTIEETHLIRLSVEDQNRFADLLLNPPEPSHALKQAKEVHRRLVRESR